MLKQSSRMMSTQKNSRNLKKETTWLYKTERGVTRSVGTELVRQYNVKIDGSNRLTLRNRKFLRKIEPVCAHRPPPPSRTAMPPESQPKSSSAEPLQSDGHLQQHLSSPSHPVVDIAPDISIEPIEPVRRSGRERRPRELFQANMQGKHHNQTSVPQS